jgi:hypothetical protein
MNLNANPINPNAIAVIQDSFFHAIISQDWKNYSPQIDENLQTDEELKQVFQTLLPQTLYSITVNHDGVYYYVRLLIHVGSKVLVFSFCVPPS